MIAQSKDLREEADEIFSQTPKTEKSDRSKKPKSVVMLRLGQQHIQSQFILVVAAFLVFTSFYFVVRMATTSRQDQNVLVMASDGSVVISPLRSISAAKSHFNSISKWVTNIIYQRTPDALVLDDLVSTYFFAYAAEDLRKDFKNAKPDLQKRAMSMFPEISSVSEPIKAGNLWYVTIEGVLNSTGRFGDKNLSERPNFKLTLTFAPNDAAYANGDAPFKVQHWDNEVWI